MTEVQTCALPISFASGGSCESGESCGNCECGESCESCESGFRSFHTFASGGSGEIANVAKVSNATFAFPQLSQL